LHGILQNENSPGSLSVFEFCNQNRLSSEQIKEMVFYAEEFREFDRIERERMEAKHKLESYACRIKSEFKNATNVSEDRKNAVLDMMEETIRWIESHLSEEKIEYENKRKGLEDLINNQELVSKQKEPPVIPVEFESV